MCNLAGYIRTRVCKPNELPEKPIAINVESASYIILGIPLSCRICIYIFIYLFIPEQWEIGVSELTGDRICAQTP